MDRRGFVRNALAGIAAISGLSRASKDDFAAALIGKPGAAGDAAESVAEVRGGKLFPTNVAAGKWLRMEAAEFTAPVCAVVYRRENEVRNGMPLGGVSTGFVDVETDGTWGQSSIFNSGVPVREKTGLPFLGINVDGRTWVLSTKETLGTGNASEIYYWGHYPVVDMEFETTAPVSAGLRAWSPFVPGNVLDSNIPGAVFEVHLRNTSSKTQEGAIALTFPGPTEAEAQIGSTSVRAERFIDWFPVHDAVAEGPAEMRRQNVSDAGFHGQIITSEKGNGYALGVIGEETARFGGPLGRAGYDFASGQQWAAIHQRLPFTPAAEPGASVAVNFALGPGESKTIRLLLAWYSPVWKGEGDHYFARMYTKHYRDTTAVAKALARDHQSLLKRVLAWQQAVYVSEDLPVWLRESLVNILHLTTKTGYWAQARSPIGGWCKEEDGLWGMNECPRDCPQIECIPCSFYGNVPVVYFFPELALSTLRGYKAYQYTDGAAPWVFGGCTSGAAVGYHATDGAEMAIPSPGYQTTLNGPCYVDMFDRYWQRTGNDEVVKEFYDSLKKNTTYTMNLRPGPGGIVSVPAGNVNPTNPKGTPGSGLDWFEGNKWFGMTPHVGGIHLAQLRMMERIAKKVGDEEYAAQCAKWREQGSKAMEEKLWAGKYYLSYYEPESGKKSELVFGYQLDGDWMCFYHGLPAVFPEARAKITLATIKNTCMAIAPYGAANFANPDGAVAASEKFMAQGWGLDYGSYGYFPPEVWMLAATFLYQDERETGMRLAESCMYGIVKYGYTWTQPNIVNGSTGKRVYGSDYYQNMILWSLPAAIEQKDLARASAPGSLVDRVIAAGKQA